MDRGQYMADIWPLCVAATPEGAMCTMVDRRRIPPAMYFANDSFGQTEKISGSAWIEPIDIQEQCFFPSCARACPRSGCRTPEPESQSPALLGANKFNVCYGPFCPSQPNQITAQKTPWLAHLHSRLGGTLTRRISIRVVLPPVLQSGLFGGPSQGATGWTAGAWFRQEQEIFLYFTVSRPALGPTQPPVRWAPGALSPRVKRPGHEADHLPPTTAEVGNGGAVPPLPHTFSWCVI
jgi:hypothetical protein